MKVAYVVLGLVCLVLGAIGVVVPLLPTTPFLLLSAWAFARGSKRLERWLLEHPRLGPPVRAWTEHGVVPGRAKLLASLLLGFSVVYAWGCPVNGIPAPARVAMVLVAAGVIGFLVTRPSEIPGLSEERPPLPPA